MISFTCKVLFGHILDPAATCSQAGQQASSRGCDEKPPKMSYPPPRSRISGEKRVARFATEPAAE